ncbi:hypothetical protein M5K25_019470 [Dendrobium thyrsiflorum]|uniref:Uncharacterized protein n=1 Tax=Dendrobium thyrsiflorum TaxID=117978 RepID=A0ABD0ULU4_DENTH
MSNILMRMQYVKIEEEDLEEKRHQRARYLIYKALEEADSLTRKSSLSYNKFYKPKAKVYVRLRKVRFIFIRARRRACLSVMKQFSYVKRVLSRKKALV